jgi:hypothetical protein
MKNPIWEKKKDYKPGADGREISDWQGGPGLDREGSSRVNPVK